MLEVQVHTALLEAINKSRDKLLGQGNSSFIWKAAIGRPRRLWTHIPRIILPELEFRLFYAKEKGCGWFCKLTGAGILCSCTKVWSQCSIKPSTRQLLFPVLQLSISVGMGKGAISLLVKP